jgi:hypothetical protein
VVRIATVAFISVVLVVGSLVVGNFGISEGLRQFPNDDACYCHGTFEPLPFPPYLEQAPNLVSIIQDHNIGHIMIWVSILIVFLLYFIDSVKDRLRWGMESAEKKATREEECVATSPPLIRLKHPPVSQQPKRHHGYRLSMLSRN